MTGSVHSYEFELGRRIAAGQMAIQCYLRLPVKASRSQQWMSVRGLEQPRE